MILPQGALTCVEYSPRDLELLLGGYDNGQIGMQSNFVKDCCAKIIKVLFIILFILLIFFLTQ